MFLFCLSNVFGCGHALFLYRPFFIVRPKSKMMFTVPPQQFEPLGPKPGIYYG